MWQQYYEPQIATRNRWVESSPIRPDHLAPRRGHPAVAGLQERGTGIARRLAAAGAAAGSVGIALLGVLGMHVFRGQPQPAGAPAAPAVHSAPDASTAVARDGVGG